MLQWGNSLSVAIDNTSTVKKRILSKAEQGAKRARNEMSIVARARDRKGDTAADVLLEDMDTGGGCASKSETQIVRRHAQALAKSAFEFGMNGDNGSLQRVSRILNVLSCRPDIREASRLTEGKEFKKTKTEELENMIMKALPQFFGELMQTDGARNKETQNAMLAALVAALPPDLFTERLGREAERVLGTSYRMLRQAVDHRAELEEQDCYRWVRIVDTRKSPSWALQDEALEIMSVWLHSDEASRPDNSAKHDVRVPRGFDEQGRRQYILHPRRMLLGSDAELWDLFTGRNRFGGKEGAPSEAWLRFQAATKTNTRTAAKGGRKLMRRMRCNCHTDPHVDKCVCPICTTFVSNLSKYHRKRNGWYYNEGERKKSGQQNATNACEMCDGLCHEAGVGRRWSASSEEALRMLMCPPERIRALEIPEIDLLTGKEKTTTVPFLLSPLACYTGHCHKCGFDRVHAAMSVFDRESLDNDDNVLQFKVRACSVEATDVPEVWNEFLKVERGEDKDGNPYYSTDWLEVAGTRAEFVHELTTVWWPKYRTHMHAIRWQRQCKKRAHHMLFYRRAIARLYLGNGVGSGVGEDGMEEKDEDGEGGGAGGKAADDASPPFGTGRRVRALWASGLGEDIDTYFVATVKSYDAERDQYDLSFDDGGEDDSVPSADVHDGGARLNGGPGCPDGCRQVCEELARDRDPNYAGDHSDHIYKRVKIRPNDSVTCDMCPEAGDQHRITAGFSWTCGQCVQFDCCDGCFDAHAILHATAVARRAAVAVNEGGDRRDEESKERDDAEREQQARQRHVDRGDPYSVVPVERLHNLPFQRLVLMARHYEGEKGGAHSPTTKALVKRIVIAGYTVEAEEERMAVVKSGADEVAKKKNAMRERRRDELAARAANQARQMYEKETRRKDRVIRFAEGSLAVDDLSADDLRTQLKMCHERTDEVKPQMKARLRRIVAPMERFKHRLQQRRERIDRIARGGGDGNDGDDDYARAGERAEEQSAQSMRQSVVYIEGDGGGGPGGARDMGGAGVGEGGDGDRATGRARCGGARHAVTADVAVAASAAGSSGSEARCAGAANATDGADAGASSAARTANAAGAAGGVDDAGGAGRSGGGVTDNDEVEADEDVGFGEAVLSATDSARAQEIMSRIGVSGSRPWAEWPDGLDFDIAIGMTEQMFDYYGEHDERDQCRAAMKSGNSGVRDIIRPQLEKEMRLSVLENVRHHPLKSGRDDDHGKGGEQSDDEDGPCGPAAAIDLCDQAYDDDGGNERKGDNADGDQAKGGDGKDGAGGVDHGDNDNDGIRDGRGGGGGGGGGGSSDHDAQPDLMVVRPPARAHGYAKVMADFAAALSVVKLYTKTCENAEPIHMNVLVIGTDPRAHRVADLPRRSRKRFERKKIGVVLKQDVTVVFAFSKQKGSAAFHATCLRDITMVLNTGRAPSGSKGEFFVNGKRLLGGDHSCPLPDGLIDATTAIPLVLEQLKTLGVERDGSKFQYQGQGNFAATMVSSYYLYCTDDYIANRGTVMLYHKMREIHHPCTYTYAPNTNMHASRSRQIQGWHWRTCEIPRITANARVMAHRM